MNKTELRQIIREELSNLAEGNIAAKISEGPWGINEKELDRNFKALQKRDTKEYGSEESDMAHWGMPYGLKKHKKMINFTTENQAWDSLFRVAKRDGPAIAYQVNLDPEVWILGAIVSQEA